MDTIKAYHTYYSIPNYVLGSNKVLEEKLSLRDEIYFKYIPKGYIYDDKTMELRIARGVDPNLIETQLKREIDVDFKPDPYEVTSFRLLVEPRDDYQRTSLNYLIGENGYSYTKTRSQLALTLPTDTGKTYVSIASLYMMKMKSMIIVHQNRIKDQWMKSLLTFTNLTDADIADINSTKIISGFMKSKVIREKVFITTHAELNSYAKKHGWNAVRELFIKLGIGVKIYDEAHLCFDNIMRVDMNTNTKKTFYLTATFSRSDIKEKTLFNFCFSNIPKYGVEVKEKKRRHTVYIGIQFDSKPTMDDKIQCRGRKSSLDRNKYCDYLFAKDTIFDAILYAIHIMREQEGRLMILSSKISSVEAIYTFMKENFPDKKVAMYHSKQSKEENDKINYADIISATPKAFGTGADFKGLKKVLMTEPFSSEVNADQYPGRLRELSSEEYTFYSELIDIGFSSAIKMYKRRLPVLKKKCTKLFELTYKKK